MLFGPDGLIKRYETPQDILVEFFDVRMQFYHKRHAFLIQVGANCVSHHTHSMSVALELLLKCTLMLCALLQCCACVSVCNSPAHCADNNNVYS